MTVVGDRVGPVDVRAHQWAGQAGDEAASAWRECLSVAGTGQVPVGLADGDRPLAEVEVLAGAVAACEYALAVRLHAAQAGGAVPFPAPGGMLAARGWSRSAARRLSRCGGLARRFPTLAGPWAAGIITAEHVDSLARAADRFTDAQLAAVIDELAPHWGQWPPPLIARFVRAADRLLHPPADPTPDEDDAHRSRFLSFALTPDAVLLAGELPRVEGELVIAGIDAVGLVRVPV